MMFRLIVFGAVLQVCFCKIFEKCELASELRFKHKMSLEEVQNWVCIAEYESTFNTEAINKDNWDGSNDFGLFQINNRYWCDDDYHQNSCGIPCTALLDDDLTDDLKCAAKIVKDTKRWMKKENGLIAWVAYTKRCQNRDLGAYIAECKEFIDLPLPTSPSQESQTTSTPEAVDKPSTTSAPETQKPTAETTIPPRGSGLGMIIPFQTRLSADLDASRPTQDDNSESNTHAEILLSFQDLPIPDTRPEEEEAMSDPPVRASGLGTMVNIENKSPSESGSRFDDQLFLPVRPNVIPNILFSPSRTILSEHEAPSESGQPTNDQFFVPVRTNLIPNLLFSPHRTSAAGFPITSFLPSRVGITPTYFPRPAAYSQYQYSPQSFVSDIDHMTSVHPFLQQSELQQPLQHHFNPIPFVTSNQIQQIPPFQQFHFDDYQEVPYETNPYKETPLRFTSQPLTIIFPFLATPEKHTPVQENPVPLRQEFFNFIK